MELNIFNKNTYKKVEAFRIAIGVVAILAAVLWILNFEQNMGYIRYRFSAISIISLIVSMILCAIYAFVIYGKKQNNLFAISTLIIAVAQVLMFVKGVFGIILYLIDGGSWYSSFFASSLVSCLSNILIGIIFVIIALYYLGKVNLKILFFPIIAIAISLISTLISSILFYFSIVYFIMDTVYLIPFLLFIVFCPPEHKRLTINVSQFQEQEIKIGDLNSQLLYLKNEFESGKIAQQEYDYTRKCLIDKL